MEIVRDVPALLNMSHETKTLVSTLTYCIEMGLFTGIAIVYYMNMIFLTLERLAAVCLGVRYPQYWDKKKTKCLIISLWLFGILLCVGVVVARALYNLEWEVVFAFYVYPILEINFILIVVVTYALIFRKRNQSLRKLRSNCNTTEGEHDQRGGGGLKKYGFFLVPSLIILTFLVFVILPDLVHFFYGILAHNPSVILNIACHISYSLANLLEGVVYIFLLPDVRVYLGRKLGIKPDYTQIQRGQSLGGGGEGMLFFDSKSIRFSCLRETYI